MKYVGHTFNRKFPIYKFDVNIFSTPKKALIASKASHCCPCCSQSHTLFKCDKFTHMSVVKRKKMIKKTIYVSTDSKITIRC